MTEEQKGFNREDVALQKEIRELYNLRNLSILWKIAEKNGDIKTLNYTDHDTKKEVKYALLDPQKDWTKKIKDRGLTEIVDLNRFVEIITKTGTTGFNHWFDYDLCFIFVVTENVPEEFRPFVAFHEAREMDLYGVAEGNIMDISYDYRDSQEREEFLKEELKEAKRYPHQQACIAEIAQVFLRGKEFSERFARWLKKEEGNPDIPDTFFNQAIPGFLKEANRLSKDPLEVLIEFFLELAKHDIFINPERFTEDWPWIEPFLAGAQQKEG